MCGRYTLARDHSGIEGRFNFKSDGFRWVPRYNIAPTQEVPVVLNNGRRRIEYMRWGLVPYGSQDLGIGSRMINARAESVLRRGVFKGSLRKRRCLVLADSFYEWKKIGPQKIPIRIGIKGWETFAFAGLWASWKSPGDEWIRSCTIITTDSNAFMQPIHNRMPVMLTREAEDIWMDNYVNDLAELAELLVPYPPSEMVAYRVSALVNHARNETLQCIVPVSDEPTQGRLIN